MTKDELINLSVQTFAEIRKFAKDVGYNKELVVWNLRTLLFIFDPDSREGSDKIDYKLLRDEHEARIAQRRDPKK